MILVPSSLRPMRLYLQINQQVLRKVFLCETLRLRKGVGLTAAGRWRRSELRVCVLENVSMCVGVRRGEMQGGAFTGYQDANWGNWQETRPQRKSW